MLSEFYLNRARLYCTWSKTSRDFPNMLYFWKRRQVRHIK